MRYLIIVNAALLALSSTMAMVMAVVWLMYRVNIELSARLETDISTVASVCIGFLVMAMALGLSFVGLVRRRHWSLYACLGAVLVVGLGCRYLYDVVTV